MVLIVMMAAGANKEVPLIPPTLPSVCFILIV